MTSIIALICIAAYISALLYGAYRIYINITERRAIASQEFSDLAGRSSAAGVSGFMDTDFQHAIEDTLTHSRTIQGVIVSGPDGEYAFERELSGAINWVGDSPRFASQLGTSSKPFFSHLRVEGLRNVTISAVYRYIDYDYFIDILKQTLLIILIFLSAAFISLILEAALGKKDEDESDLLSADRLSADRLSAGEPVIRDDEFYTPPPRPQPHPAVVPPIMPYPVPHPGSPPYHPPVPPFAESRAAARSAPAVKQVGEPVTPAQMPEVPPASEPPKPAAPARPQEPLTTELPTAILPTAAPARPDVPRGLYSPRGIGWEDYTLERLEAELHRCASFEQDLTVMVMEYRAANADESSPLGSAIYTKLTDAVVSFFNIRDLIFEKGKQGLSVIIPNTDLEQGLTRAEEFHGRLQSELAILPPVGIGLSSRAGRLVNADRILFEAAQAMRKTKQDPASPIIAFKSDPEKYRDFIQRSQ
ncbi:hypothetical protein AGMMS50267_11760 [Spirochaetia bacterium]|nr:hypothetical protein AGMMS50267_11760 [Spirochaetia bacterium]